MTSRGKPDRCKVFIKFRCTSSTGGITCRVRSPTHLTFFRLRRKIWNPVPFFFFRSRADFPGSKYFFLPVRSYFLMVIVPRTPGGLPVSSYVIPGPRSDPSPRSLDFPGSSLRCPSSVYIVSVRKLLGGVSYDQNMVSQSNRHNNTLLLSVHNVYLLVWSLNTPR